MRATAQHRWGRAVVRMVTWAFVVALAWTSSLEAAPVKVRLLEGNVRGFLLLRTTDGEIIAHGELLQRPRGALVESRLTLNFADGSLRDERATFSQKDAFRLEAYRLVQRGPSFPTYDVSFDRRSGRFQARTQDKPGDEVKEASGTLEMPDDLYNGLALVLLKNLPSSSPVSTRIAVFTPKPRIIKMDLIHEGDDPVRVGPASKTARRYLVKLEVGGLTGVIASVIGKDPPDSRYWLMSGEIPAFVRFEGAMYLNGPTWRLDLAPVEWPK